jgi:PhnB protein
MRQGVFVMPKEQKIVPYLTTSNATKMLDFLKAGLGAKIVSKMPAEDGKRLMHAEAVINGHSVFLSDDFIEYSGGKTPEKFGGTPVTMHLILKRPKDVDAWMERAVKSGAKVVMPAEDMFWGDRYGQVSDPFGHSWAFGAALPKPKNKKKAQARKAPAKSAPKKAKAKRR